MLPVHILSSLSFLAILPDQVSTDGGMLWCPNWTNQHYPSPCGSSRRKGPLSVLAARQSCPHEPTGKLTGRVNNCCFFLPLSWLVWGNFLVCHNMGVIVHPQSSNNLPFTWPLVLVILTALSGWSSQVLI